MSNCLSSAGSKGKKRKGLTLEEVEELEGSTVKESKVGMAASRRADKRKQSRAHEGEQPVLSSHTRSLS